MYREGCTTDPEKGFWKSPKCEEAARFSVCICEHMPSAVVVDAELSTRSIAIQDCSGDTPRIHAGGASWLRVCHRAVSAGDLVLSSWATEGVGVSRETVFPSRLPSPFELKLHTNPVLFTLQRSNGEFTNLSEATLYEVWCANKDTASVCDNMDQCETQEHPQWDADDESVDSEDSVELDLEEDEGIDDVYDDVLPSSTDDDDEVEEE